MNVDCMAEAVVLVGDVPFPLAAIAMRWVHIACAIVAVGGPFFMRFILLPAAKSTLDDATHVKLRGQIMRRWRIIVYVAIAGFLVSGLYTFLVLQRWADPKWTRLDRALYQALFGVKTMAALAMFFLASALSGRSAALEPMRQKAKFWLTVFLLLALVVVACSGVLRYIPL